MHTDQSEFLKHNPHAREHLRAVNATPSDFVKRMTIMSDLCLSKIKRFFNLCYLRHTVIKNFRSDRL